MMSVLETTRAAAISTATPPGRDRVIDFLRAASLAVVIAGHWLMATLVVTDGTITGANALSSLPYLHPFTWVLQVMPLFFVAGGFANLRVWRGVQRRGGGYAVYVHGRLVRLLRPTLVFVLVTHLAQVGLRAVGIGESEVELVGQLLGQPLWFLGVYVLVTALVPALAWWHERHPVGLGLTLFGTAAGIDLLRLVWLENLGYVNFGVVWLFAAQLGFWYADGRITTLSRRQLWSVVVTVIGALVALTTVGPYPVSMIGLPGEMSNMTPPSICLLLLAVGQTAAVMLARPRLTAWLHKPRPWAAVAVVGSMGMTMYLWHLVVLVAGFAATLWLGIPLAAPGSGEWWVTRPIWLASLGLVLVGLAAVLSRFDRSTVPRQPVGASTVRSTVVASAGACLAAIGLLGFALYGVGPSHPYALTSTLVVVAGLVVTTRSVGRDGPVRLTRSTRSGRSSCG